MSEGAVRILLFRLPRLVADLFHSAAGDNRDVVLIDGGAERELAAEAVSTSADVVITSAELQTWPGDCAALVVERSPLAVFAVDPAAGSTRTLESHGLGDLSPGELLVSAVAHAKRTA